VPGRWQDTAGEGQGSLASNILCCVSQKQNSQVQESRGRNGLAPLTTPSSDPLAKDLLPVPVAFFAGLEVIRFEGEMLPSGAQG
jgi:hypothetical protein